MMTPQASGRGTSLSEFAFVEQGTAQDCFRDALALLERYGERAYEEARTRARQVRLGKVVELNCDEGRWDRGVALHRPAPRLLRIAAAGRQEAWRRWSRITYIGCR